MTTLVTICAIVGGFTIGLFLARSGASFSWGFSVGRRFGYRQAERKLKGIKAPNECPPIIHPDIEPPPEGL